MSRTNRSRGRNSHHYRSDHLSDYKREGNRWMRQHVKQRLKADVLDDDYEKRLPSLTRDLFDNWWALD